MTPETQGAAGSRDLAATVITAPARLRARRAGVLGRVFASLAVVVASAGAIGGCTASRNELGNHDNACFRVLPEALAAVHHRGHFAGARYLAPKALIVQLHHVVVPDALADASKVATCLVAFTGRFSVSDVTRGWAPTGSSGHIAIVVVRQRDLVLLATVVLSRIPPRLVFAHVFPLLH